MVEWFSNWAGAIIVAVIIGTIIEMILPSGNSKKYIKVVIGIYILFTIISPVISKLKGNPITVSDVLDITEYVENTTTNSKIENTLYTQNEKNIKEIYVDSLKKDITSKVEGKNYVVDQIDVTILDDENYTLKQISLAVSKTEEVEDKSTNNIEEVSAINKIEIEVGPSKIEENNNGEENKKEKLSNKEKNDLKEYLSGVYEIAERDIQIE